MFSAVLRSSRNRMTSLITSVAPASSHMAPKNKKLLEKVNKFAEVEGRQPRILIAKMGKGGNDPDTMRVATSFADYGFDVDLGPRIQTPEEVARHAIDADVHAVGVRNVAEEKLELVTSLVKELHKLGRTDIPVVVACDIPVKEHQKLYDAGVTAVLSPKADVAERAEKTLDYIEKAFSISSGTKK